MNISSEALRPVESRRPQPGDVLWCAVAIGLAIALLVASFIVPADDGVYWPLVFVSVAASGVLAAIMFGWLIPSLAARDDDRAPIAGLISSVVALVSAPVFFVFGLPAVLAVSGVLLGRVGLEPARGARRQNIARAAMAIGVLAWGVTLTFAVLGIADVLPDWPPDSI